MSDSPRKAGQNKEKKSVLDEMGEIAAQYKAVGRGAISLPGGSRLYAVPDGWESKTIRAAEGVTVCDTLRSFEEALRGECKTLFIPLGAAVTDGDIERICQRNGAVKTIYREVEKE